MLVLGCWIDAVLRVTMAFLRIYSTGCYRVAGVVFDRLICGDSCGI